MPSQSSLASNINQHVHPAWLLRHPGWLRILWWWYQLIYPRVWITKKLLRKHLPKQQNFHLIDAGFGEGQFLWWLVHHYPKGQFIGLDLMDSNVDLAKAYQKNQDGKNVALSVHNITNPLPYRAADFLLCVGVIHCIKNDQIALANIYNSLKENSLAFIYSPINQKRILPFFNRVYQRFQHYEAHWRQHNYLDMELRLRLVRAGFSIEAVHYTNGWLGRLGYELYTMLFVVITGQVGWLVRGLAVLGLILFLPLILGLNFVDYLLPKRSGNGAMYVVKKRS